MYVVEEVEPSQSVFIPVADACAPPRAAAGNRNAMPKAWVVPLYCVITACIGVYVYADSETLISFWDTVEENEVLHALIVPSIVWASAEILLLCFRTVVWIRYRPFPPAELANAPALTVVIPAYNEGAMVLKSIESVVAAHYPRDKLEVLVVDDGSKDDTWTHIETAASRYPDLINAFRFPANQGKRAALARGFSEARGEFVVTLDSDSVIEPDALLAIVGPFRNPRVGAVAGKVMVYNRHAGLIPRMLHVRFLLTFDVLRAVESSYGTVYCCPGALTAYRLSAVKTVLPAWLEQNFLGSRCTFGEDRAMTNYLLDAAFDTVYQSSAEVHTVVPTDFRKLCRMFLRWDRSYVREELRFLKIVWKRPHRSRWISAFDRLTTNLHYPVGYAALVVLGSAVLANPLDVVRCLLVLAFVSIMSSLYCLRSEPSPRTVLHGLMFAYYSAFLMSWIMPWAFFSVRARSWLTR